MVNYKLFLQQLEEEHQRLGNLILQIRPLAEGRPRRGRPPLALQRPQADVHVLPVSTGQPRRRGRPPGSKNKHRSMKNVAERNVA